MASSKKDLSNSGKSTESGYAVKIRCFYAKLNLKTTTIFSFHCIFTSQLWNLFVALNGTMLENMSNRRSAGGLFQLAFGEPYGGKEPTNVLKIGVASY
ncbi:hypothetical protein H5410_030929, partial [Solanum commersonii]